MLEVIRDIGQPLEEFWPYLTQEPTWLTQWNPPSISGTFYKRISELLRCSADEILRVLDSGLPVVVYYQFDKPMFSPEWNVLRLNVNFRI